MGTKFEVSNTGLVNFKQNGTEQFVLEKGTSFPGTPIQGQIFYRTDLDRLFVYNGTDFISISAGWTRVGTNILLVTSTDNVGIGAPTPTEKLEVAGAIVIGNAAGTADGTIRWTGSDFEGRKSGSWTSLTSAGTTSTDGWVSADETWTHASSTTFTVSGDVTNKYEIGDRLKLNNTTTKYFYIIGKSFGGGTTTITVTGGTDYSLTSDPITSNFYSKVINPVNFPHWLNYTSTVTGTTSSTSSARFRLTGRECTLFLLSFSSFTSNSTSFTITAPIASGSPGSVMPYSPIITGRDNSNVIDTVYLTMNQGTTTITVNKAVGAAWTASGQKGFDTIYYTYEI
jgi:hypothetical protein